MLWYQWGCVARLSPLVSMTSSRGIALVSFMENVSIAADRPVAHFECGSRWDPQLTHGRP